MTILTHKYGSKAGIVTLASSLLLTSLVAQNTAAQEAAESDPEGREIEEVFVSGVRQSLKNAQDIKRDASTFVDAISASDIGALPDRSVLEAISRIPGVSIERFASPDDPDRFSSEGSGAVVRGMTATRTEFNGRDSFTASSGRGLSFQDISPELMGSVELAKNQTADMIEGGIGGTVTMYTRKPFDQDDRLVALSADYTYFDLSGLYAPAFSGLYSDRWSTGIGEFGLLVGMAHSKSKGRSDGIQSAYYNSNDNTDGTFNSQQDNVRYPSGASLGTKLDLRERIGTSISMQFENLDNTFIATSDIIRSDSTLRWEEQKINIGTWDSNYGTHTRPAEGTSWGFDDGGIFNEGIIGHGADGWRGDRWEDPNDGLGTGYDNLRVPDGPTNNGNCYGLAEGELPSEDDNCNLRSATFGMQSGTSTYSRVQHQNTLVTDYSLNFKFMPNDQWEFTADFQYVDALSSTDDITLNTGFWGLVYSNNTGDTPQMAVVNPWDVVPDGTYYQGADEAGSALYNTKGNLAQLEQTEIDNGGYTNAIDRNASDYYAQPSSYWWDSASDTYMRASGEEFAGRLDATYFIEDSFFTEVKAGVRRSSRHQEVRDVNYSNWGALSGMRDLDTVNGEQGHAAAWLDLNNTAYEMVDWSEFYRGDGTYLGNATISGNGVSPTSGESDFLTIHPAMSLVNRYDLWGSLLHDVTYQGNDRAWRPAQYRDTNRDGIIDTQGYFLPEELSDIEEVNKAAYVRVDFGDDDARFRYTGNIGLRYYQVDLESTGYVRFPDLRPSYPDPADPQYGGDLNNYLPTSDRQFGNAGTQITFAENSYGHLLPSFNLKVEFTSDLLARFAISKAVSLPDIGDLRSYINIGALTNADYQENDPNDTLEYQQVEEGTAEVLAYTASGGNPYLVPMESIQYDASLEWYFDDVGSLTASIFYKDLENFFVDGAFARPVTNPDNDVVKDVNVSGVVNGGSGSLQGFEVAYQQYYDMLPEPFDGFGTQINYSWIDVDGVPNPALEGAEDNRGEAITQDLPLQSQSEHTANATLMYEKGEFDFRMAYNWRSEYLVTARDGANLPFPPTWAGASGFLDASLFYNISDEIKIGIQGNNLTDTVSTTEYQNTNGLEREGRSWFLNDRRYTLVLRASF
ncbi:TonB-dependent receptor [Teredinibacter purpureus]|uniref:TonB-dependent receptor n=1 Tax=Teredinibacter purpureus TaxID=2731756 RepID=UPI0006983D8C|nr:TonB-dependent receptor [Teredinibacter purpureus]